MFPLVNVLLRGLVLHCLRRWERIVQNVLSLTHKHTDGKVGSAWVCKMNVFFCLKPITSGWNVSNDTLNHLAARAATIICSTCSTMPQGIPES